MSKKRKESLIKNTTILGFGTLCTKGIMFLMTPLFTRWLSQEEYGTFDLLATYVTLFMPLITLASGEAVFRFLIDSKDNDHNSTVLSTAFFIDVIGVIITIFIGIISVFIFKLNFTIVAFFLFYLITETFYNYFMMSVRGEGKLNLYAIGNILFVFGLALFVTVFILIFKMGLPGILLGYSFGNIISILVTCLISKVNKKIKISNCSKKEFKEIVRYSAPLIPNSISWWIANASDRTLISIFLGSSYNAIYAVANKIPALCTTFFNVFHLSWQQNATETLSDEDRDIYYNSVFNNMVSIVCSICIFILGINFLFFKLFSEDYFSGIYQSPILVIAIIFSMMGQFIGGIYIAQMKSKKNGFTTVMAALVNIVVDFLLIKNLGLYAASLSTLISYAILFIIRFFDIRKEIKLKFNKKNYVIFAIVLYFTIFSYIDIFAFKIINLIIGIICFLIINLEFVKKILKKYIKN